MNVQKFSVKELIEYLSSKCPVRIENRELLSFDPNQSTFENVSDLKGAQKGDLAFFFSKAFLNDLLSSSPGVLITGDAFVPHLLKSGHPLLKSTILLSAANPYFAMACVSKWVAPFLSKDSHVPGQFKEDSIIDSTARIHPSVKLGKKLKIGPYVVIEEGSEIGDGVTLYSGVTVGKKVSIGSDSTLFPKVTLYENTKIGNRVRLHAGVVIGADGFGYAPLLEAGVVVDHEKIYHFGKVVVGDDVEIGANSLVDRGTFGDTTISNKVKIDNHCHVGHNSFVDEGAILCGGVCLAGGAHVGKFVYVGGMSGIGKYTIGDRAKVGGMSSVDKDVESGETLVGFPGRSHRDFYKLQVLFNRLLEDRKKSRKKD